LSKKLDLWLPFKQTSVAETVIMGHGFFRIFSNLRGDYKKKRKKRKGEKKRKKKGKNTCK